MFAVVVVVPAYLSRSVFWVTHVRHFSREEPSKWTNRATPYDGGLCSRILSTTAGNAHTDEKNIFKILVVFT